MDGGRGGVMSIELGIELDIELGTLRHVEFDGDGGAWVRIDDDLVN